VKGLWWKAGIVLVVLVLLAAAHTWLVIKDATPPGPSGTEAVAESRMDPSVRPMLWLDAVNAARGTLPNVVYIAVIAAESGGVNGHHYTCAFGPGLPVPCQNVWFGLDKTVSAGVGLMGLPSDPSNPEANIKAGVARLDTEMGRYHYLEYALEAYDGAKTIGAAAPTSAKAFAQEVLADIKAYESGPTIREWGTAPAYSQPYSIESSSIDPTDVAQYQASPHQPYWLFLIADGPYGSKSNIPWATGASVSVRTLLPVKHVWSSNCNVTGQTPWTLDAPKSPLPRDWSVFDQYSPGGQGYFDAVMQWSPSLVAWVGVDVQPTNLHLGANTPPPPGTGCTDIWPGENDPNATINTSNLWYVSQ